MVPAMIDWRSMTPAADRTAPAAFIMSAHFGSVPMVAAGVGVVLPETDSRP